VSPRCEVAYAPRHSKGHAQRRSRQAHRRRDGRLRRLAPGIRRRRVRVPALVDRPVDRSGRRVRHIRGGARPRGAGVALLCAGHPAHRPHDRARPPAPYRGWTTPRTSTAADPPSPAQAVALPQDRTSYGTGTQPSLGPIECPRAIGPPRALMRRHPTRGSGARRSPPPAGGASRSCGSVAGRASYASGRRRRSRGGARRAAGAAPCAHAGARS
jgi:hypothetical protein